MGVLNLFSFMNNTKKKTNLKNFKGATLGIDISCWLHASLYSLKRVELKYENIFEDLELLNSSDCFLDFIKNKLKIFEENQINCVVVFDGKKPMIKQIITEARSHKRETKLLKANDFFTQIEKINKTTNINFCKTESQKSNTNSEKSKNQDFSKVDTDLVIAQNQNFKTKKSKKKRNNKNKNIDRIKKRILEFFD